MQVPNLNEINGPYILNMANIIEPRMVSLVGDGSAIVADGCKGCPAVQVWLDDSQSPQDLPRVTCYATAVLMIDQTIGNGMIVVSPSWSGVERTGRRAPVWTRKDLGRPYGAVICGDEVFVTSSDGYVAILNIDSGETLAMFGDDLLESPRGIAIGLDGEIVVADDQSNLVHVFSAEGELLRTLSGNGLQSAYGLCVDDCGRVYIADYAANAIVVLDGESGDRLADIDVDGVPYGVAVTPNCQIVVSGNGMPVAIYDC